MAGAAVGRDPVKIQSWCGWPGNLAKEIWEHMMTLTMAAKLDKYLLSIYSVPVSASFTRDPQISEMKMITQTETSSYG